MADISTWVGWLRLDSCIFNASGPKCESLEELETIGQSASGAILTKSCTLLPREGNPEPRYIDFEGGSFNSMGLPNLGYEKYVEFAPQLKNHGKPLIISVAGLTLEDNLRIVRRLNNSAYDAVELNLSCPNVMGKPQVGYDFAATERYLKEILGACKKPLGIKLPPYFDFSHFETVSGIIKKFPVKFVTCTNSIGNALVVDPEKEAVVIRPKGGFGGMGGRCVKYTALANVRKFYELMPEIPVIGVGGIFSGKDVFEFILAGAAAVQLGTVFMQEGPGVFGRMEKELKEIMEGKGYSSIHDFRGKLKTLE
jgi:dihydroorotate dehydrogenase (fumarate)